MATLIGMDTLGFLPALEKFMRDKGITLLLLLSGTTDEQGNRTRELGLAAHDEALVKRVVWLVDRDNTLQIEPNPCSISLPASTTPYTALFYQRNRDASRKVVLPLIKRLLESGTS